MRAAREALEERIGYQFNDTRLLDQALTHRSWTVEQPGSCDNEQLEFLGDSILGFAVSEALFRAYPQMNEGQLTLRKAQVVCEAHLHSCANELKLGEFLKLGRGEERNGGRQRKSVLADAVEAIIAAIFLDGGLGAAKMFIEQHVQPASWPAESAGKFTLLDHKGALQEQAQSRGLPTPRYVVVATTGPEHSKMFTVEAQIGNQFTHRAEGPSKKAASQLAARELAKELNESGWEATITSNASKADSQRASGE